MNSPKKGFSIHCHHDILLEYCFDYEERVNYIKKDKPKDQQEIRLRVFKILSKEALKDIPQNYLEAYQKWQEAYQKWKEVNQKWTQKAKDKFHKKWCVPDCPWNGTELVFNQNNEL